GASMFDTGTLPIFSEFVGSFLDMAPQQIEELKEAYSLQDAEGVRLAAHTLKGSCSFLGIESLTAACLDMEEAGRTNTLDGRRDVLDRIETDLSALRRDLLEEPRAPAD
ncbi:Hpt domain-containing protein, partial [Bosea sp. (in: a-proteobacteria)]|uniref:Hpt domain-containing protein n=1 Tax=Bosea sp. (in: a-proteobacteria) TaxID=1871050 RepID=UPI0031FE9D5B